MTLLMGVCAMLLGFFVFYGWLQGGNWLTSFTTSSASTTPSTALGFVITGLAMVGLVRESTRSAWRVLVGVLASALLIFGTSFLGLKNFVETSDLTRWWFAIDASQPLAVAPATATAFLCAGLALLVHIALDASLRWLAGAFGGLVLLAGLVGLGNHLTVATGLGGLASFASMALPTAIGFILVGLGLVAARGIEHLGNVLSREHSARSRDRWWLPLCLLVPLLLSALVLELALLTTLPVELLFVVATLGYSLVFGAVLWSTQRGLVVAETEKTQTQSQLRDHEMWSQGMVESLPYPVWTSDADGRCDYLSPQWSEYTGESTVENQSETWFSLAHEDDQPVLRRKWRESVETGKRFTSDFRLRYHDGSFRWFQASARPKRNDQARILKWFGSLSDIHDLKITQGLIADSRAALEELVARRTDEVERSQADLANAQAVARMGSWSLDTVEGTVRWSDELYRIFRVPPESTVPPFTEHRAFFTEESWHRFHRAVQESLRTGEGFELELAISQSDSELSWVEARARAVSDAQGRVERLTGTLQDITLQKNLARELKGKSLRLKLAVSAGSIGVWDWDISANTIDWDQNMRTLHGYPRGPVTYETWRGRVHSDDLAEVEAAIQAAVEEDKSFDHEYTVVHPDGRLVRVKSRALVIRDDDGKALHMIGVNIDDTQAWQARRQLERQQIELSASNQDLQQFAYVASHDLQEPLRAVAGCAQILQKRYQSQLDAEGDELIRHVVEGAQRMQQLIQDLLAYSKVGAKNLALQPTALRDTINRALANLTDSIRETGAEFDIAPDLPVVAIDPAQGLHLFQNLFSNALKYRHPERLPRVSIAASAVDGFWHVSVADNGIGIPEKYASRVFELFQRLHTRDEVAGTGIGLAICTRIVERHGGTIWIETAQPHGTTFKFSLPQHTPSSHSS